MAIYRGCEGLIKQGGNTIAQVRNWSLEQSADTTDSSIMGDEWQHHVVLLKSWTGAATVFWDISDKEGQAALLIGKQVTLHVYPQANSSYFKGEVLVTGLSVNGDVGNAIEANFTFQGTGELTLVEPGKKSS